MSRYINVNVNSRINNAGRNKICNRSLALYLLALEYRFNILAKI